MLFSDGVGGHFVFVILLLQPPSELFLKLLGELVDVSLGEILGVPLDESLNEPASQLIGESSSKLGVDNFNDFLVDVGNEHIQAEVLGDGDEELRIDVIRDSQDPVP